MEDQPQQSDLVKDKVEAIYELREAVEQKVHAEIALHREGSPQARDATLQVEVVRMPPRSHTNVVVESASEATILSTLRLLISVRGAARQLRTAG